MTRSVTESIALPHGPESVWEVVGDLAGLGVWVPGVLSCRLDDDVRHVALGRGGTARERIVEVDEKARSYDYEYLSGGLPLDRYTARVSVEAAPRGSVVTWTGSISARTPEVEDEMARLISSMYTSALAALGEHLSARFRSAESAVPEGRSR